MSKLVCAPIALLPLTCLLVACGSAGEGFVGDRPPCARFCTLVDECAFDALLDLASSDDCMAYCEGNMPAAIAACALDEANECADTWACYEVEAFGPGYGPGPECNLPPLECDDNEDYCGELIQFDPTEGDGYIDYPENSETWDSQHRSWLRRDAVMAIQHAAARVRCKSADWRYGNGDPIGLVDMSEEDGSIPGTSTGNPDHPAATHQNGFDIDVAYYQKDTEDNRARSICDHVLESVDAEHCIADPHILDEWRQALFIGTLFEHPNLRVIGCDGRAGPRLNDAIEALCQRGWLSEAACQWDLLAWETSDGGLGWFKSHHHHIHVSFQLWEDDQKSGDWLGPCLVPGCNR